MEKKCPLCNGSAKILYSSLYDKDYFVPGKFSLNKCSNCELKFIEPLLNEKQLAKYYPPSKYYSYHKKSKLSILYHKISADYYSNKNPLLNILFWSFSSLLYHYRIDPGKKLLEIGCGDGMQLEFYKKYGLKTAGLEPYGPNLTQREKNLGIERKNILESNFSKESFDYIVMKEVLEHISNQDAILKKSYSLLKTGGKLIIVVPNGDGLWNKIFGKNWYGYDIPRHLYTYNPKNIRIRLKKIGFKINKIRTYDIPYMLDGSIKFYLVDKQKDKRKEHNFIFSSLSKILFTPISLLVTYMKRGSILEIEAEK
ncbi:class I SAM-dependent methyltransferase [Candidatus Pacearchaeota archaeon]|nr:class I SAM-dependent methyltransferase [Candidatus Pacearchaeota archaeon]